MLIATVKTVLTLEIKIQSGQKNESIEEEANSIIAKLIANGLANIDTIKRSNFVDYTSSVSNIIDRTNLIINAINGMTSMDQGPRSTTFIGNEEECEVVKQAYDKAMGYLNYQLDRKVYTSYCLLREVNSLRQEVIFLGVGYGDLDYDQIAVYNNQIEETDVSENV